MAEKLPELLDYREIGFSIAEIIGKATKPLTSTQRLCLIAALPAWFEKAISECRASPSVGGVRVPDEMDLSDGFPEEYQYGWNACIDEVLRLNPAAEVGEVEHAEVLAKKLDRYSRCDGLVALGVSDAEEIPALLRRLSGSEKEMK